MRNNWSAKVFIPWVMGGGLFLLSLIALRMGCKNMQGGGMNAPERDMAASNASLENIFNIESIFDKPNVYPLVIVGSGPAGLTAAIYGAREKLQPLIFRGGEPGGLLMKTTDVTNWPGEKVIIGRDLIERLNEQVEAVGVEWRDDSVVSIDVSEWPYAIQTDSDEEGQRVVYALSIVIATGASSLKLGVPGEDKYWGSGVTTCAICDASLKSNLSKTAVVVGGGDSAIEEAMQSAAHQKQVTVLVRKDRLRAAASMQQQAKKISNIDFKFNVEVKEVLGGMVQRDIDGTSIPSLQMTGVRLYNNKTGEESIFPAQMLFLAIGHIPNTEFVKDILELDSAGYIKLQPGSQETSVKGIFAAGEVSDHRYRQAITSAGYGAAAGLDAVAFLQKVGFNSDVSQKLERLKKESR
jgi:thioredoxin reductase (NADPH)